MVAIYVLYAPAALLTPSTIVIRPSRVAITVGILLLIMLNRYQSFRGWIANMNFPTQRSLGPVLQFYNAINPSFMAYRSLAIIFYFICDKNTVFVAVFIGFQHKSCSVVAKSTADSHDIVSVCCIFKNVGS